MLIGVVIATLIVWQLPESTMSLGICQGLAIALLVVMVKLLQMFIETNRLRWHDKLTGLGNRNFLEDRFGLAKERATRNNSVFALLMIDLNNFKSINDHYGHAAGDEVLIAVARRLSASVRGTDSVIRLGGDEFVVLVEEAEKPEGLFHLGQKLMDTFFDNIELSNHQLVHVGASMGMARFPVDGVEVVQLLDLADQGMYESKASQRMPIEQS
jgi:diguanylate cyclase (GGDEF)-like protein